MPVINEQTVSYEVLKRAFEDACKTLEDIAGWGHNASYYEELYIRLARKENKLDEEE